MTDFYLIEGESAASGTFEVALGALEGALKAAVAKGCEVRRVLEVQVRRFARIVHVQEAENHQPRETAAAGAVVAPLCWRPR